MGRSLSITCLHIFLSAGSHQGAFSKALPEPLKGTHPSSLNQRVSAFPLNDEIGGSTKPASSYSKPCIWASFEKFSSRDIRVALSGCFFSLLPLIQLDRHMVPFDCSSLHLLMYITSSFLPSSVFPYLTFFSLMCLCFSGKTLTFIKDKFVSSSLYEALS